MPNHDHQDVLHLVQITDAHLGRCAGDQLLGLDTDQSLTLVLDLIRQQQPKIDLLLATGDLSNNGSIEAYQRFDQLTRPLCAQRQWLPGNHDSLDVMRAALDHSRPLAKVIQLPHWQIIMLNSMVVGEVGGHLAEPELELLRAALAAPNTPNTLVCLHHHPISCGSDWLDTQRVDNADALLEIIDHSLAVRGVLWGHIHQQVDQWRGPVKLMASPSTCIQFAKNSPGFKLDRRNPGYRWLKLFADGTIESQVERLQGVEFAIDYEQSTGY